MKTYLSPFARAYAMGYFVRNPEQDAMFCERERVQQDLDRAKRKLERVKAVQESGEQLLRGAPV